MHSSGKNSPAAGLSPYKIAKMENEHISKLYTTNLNEIIEVHCH